MMRAAPLVWRGGLVETTARDVPEETAVAMSYDRVSFAVMMATPADLQDFAVGFSISEGIVSAPGEITELDIVVVPDGIECRMALTPSRRDVLAARRRRIAGPVGCGLCGLDSLREVTRPAPPVHSTARVAAATIVAGMARMAAQQTLNRQTRAVHAAGFLNGEALQLREDVGRHNALDKLIGGVLRGDQSGADGVLLLTSRVSLDLIQKAAMFGAPILGAISVPTAAAIRAAEAAGITLIGIARQDGFEVFTHPERIVM